METTFYNHSSFGDLPLIPGAVYKQLITDIKAGDKSALDRAKKLYSLEKHQLSLAEDLNKQFNGK